jgi:hypothetical protein
VKHISPPYYESAMLPRPISKPLARLLRFIAVTPPPVRIEPAVFASTKRGIWPIQWMLNESVFRDEMRVIHMRREVPIVAYSLLILLSVMPPERELVRKTASPAIRSSLLSWRWLPIWITVHVVPMRIEVQSDPQ